MDELVISLLVEALVDTSGIVRSIMPRGCWIPLSKSAGGVSRMGLGEFPLMISASSELGIFRSILMDDLRLALCELT